MRARATVLAGAAAVAALAAPVVWGAVVEPYRLDCRDEVAYLPGLLPGWDGQRLALFGDLQVGLRWANLSTARRAVGQVVAARPAAALLTGDLLYHPASRLAAQLRTLVRLLQPLPAAGIPTYAVLGNHDYPRPQPVPDPARVPSVRALRAALGAIGVRVLVNDVVPLAPPTSDAASPLYLVGLDTNLRGSAGRGAATLRQVPAGAPRVVLLHNPAAFRALPAGAAPLGLAGHTHGGQICLPGKPEWSGWALIHHEVRLTAGWLPDGGAPGKQLYVNRGIGFSHLPLRFGCPPEVTIFTLHPA